VRAKWLETVDDKDLDAGRRYLELLFAPTSARALVRALKSAAVHSFAAKDVLRASELQLLPAKDPDVARQLKKIHKGAPLSPLLLVRETGHARLVVADGFHRLCAVMHVDENAEVACKIA